MTVKEAIKGLNYQTESDSEWSFTIYPTIKPMIGCKGLQSLLVRPPLTGCEVLDFDGVLSHLAHTQPQGSRYNDLYTALTDNWSSYGAFKLTPSEREGYTFDLVFVGYNEQNEVEVILASGVET